MAKRKPSPALQAELPRDRCPNCGGPLKFPEHRKEGLCAACGIFVEIVFSTPDSGPPEEEEVPDVASRRETAKFYLASEELLMDEAEAESPAEAGKAGDPRTAESETVPPAPKPEEPAVGGGLPAGAPERCEPEASSPQNESVKETPLIREQQSPPEIAPQLGPPAEPESSLKAAPPVPPAPESTAEAPPEPEPPAPETLTQELADQEIAEPGPAIAEAETVVEPESEVVEETEVVGEPGAEAELTFEEPASTYAVDEQEAVVPAPTAVAPAAQVRAAASGRIRSQPRLRDRVLLYVGSILVAFGGSGLILGSILHDLFRVPWFGYAYEAFGPVNLSAMIFGGIFLVAGLAAIGVSLRGGVVNVRQAARA